MGDMSVETGHKSDVILSGVADSAVPLVQSTLPGLPTGDLETSIKKVSASEDVPMDVYSVQLRAEPNHLLPFPCPPFRSQGRDTGRYFRGEKMHFLPATNSGCAVSLSWPRDEKGKPIPSQNKRKGKRIPGHYAWGETIYDFFQVKMAPARSPIPTLVMTSSALLKTMKDFGELRMAKHEIEWAKSEGEPKVQNVASTQNLVEMVEQKVYRSKTEYVIYSAARDTISAESLDTPVTSPFHPSHSPLPWPLVPFKHLDTQILLQERIPSFLLPQTLYVHDPFNLLRADRRVEVDNCEWTSRPDVVHTCALKLRDKTLTKVDSERKKAEELEELKARTSIILRYTQITEQMQDRDPIVDVVLPPYPRRLTKVDESHLYLSPLGKVGKGNHSVVYEAEWELPRDLFVRPKICASCLRESMEMEIERLKATGEWDSMLQGTETGAEEVRVFVRSAVESNKMEEVSDPLIGGKDEEIVEREIICVVSSDIQPMDVFGMIESRGVWQDLVRHKEKTRVLLRFVDETGIQATECRSRPIIRIHPAISYHNPHTMCSHNLTYPVPWTTKFMVTAKLSIEGDGHLKAEARNYQKFPDYFFEHWSGYTFLARLQSIVPLGAIVPQFYGYYTLKTKGTAREEGGQAVSGYLSSILLLEHCGIPIEMIDLTLQEQEECASLFLRFNRAGWLHESVYPRNVLVQQRPRLEGTSLGDLSFRLIDFGRSKESADVSEREEEESVMRKLFKDLPNCGPEEYSRGKVVAWLMSIGQGDHPTGEPLAHTSWVRLC